MTVPSCKNVTLHSGEYTINKNGTLTTRHSVLDFDSNDYRRKSGFARVCFPFNENFIRCPKWKFDPGELRQNPSDKSVTYVGANLTYDIGNYVISSDNSTLVCVPKSCLPPAINLDAIFVFLWIISIVGLILSIVLYTPRTNGRYHLKSAIFHMTCLLGCYVFIIIFQLSSGYRYIWENYLTYCNLFVMYGAYTWLNVICYDAWRLFHSKRLFSLPPVTAKGFVYRSLYAWGMPMLLILSLTIPEYFGCCDQTTRVQRVGIKGDLLNSFLSFGSVSLSIFANVVFFALVVRNLRQLREELSSVNDCTKDIPFNIRMHIKLIVVMGLTLVCVIVAMILGPTYEIYYSLFDAIISLQGFFLFLIYGWTPLIKKARALRSILLNFLNILITSFNSKF